MSTPSSRVSTPLRSTPNRFSSPTRRVIASPYLSSPLSSSSFIINNVVITLPEDYEAEEFPILVCAALNLDSSLLLGLQHTTCGYIPLSVALKHFDKLPHRGLTTVLKPENGSNPEDDVDVEVLSPRKYFNIHPDSEGRGRPSTAASGERKRWTNLQQAFEDEEDRGSHLQVSSPRHTVREPHFDDDDEDEADAYSVPVVRSNGDHLQYRSPTRVEPKSPFRIQSPLRTAPHTPAKPTPSRSHIPHPTPYQPHSHAAAKVFMITVSGHVLAACQARCPSFPHCSLCASPRLSALIPIHQSSSISSLTDSLLAAFPFLSCGFALDDNPDSPQLPLETLVCRPLHSRNSEIQDLLSRGQNQLPEETLEQLLARPADATVCFPGDVPFEAAYVSSSYEDEPESSCPATPELGSVDAVDMYGEGAQRVEDAVHAVKTYLSAGALQSALATIGAGMATAALLITPSPSVHSQPRSSFQYRSYAELAPSSPAKTACFHAPTVECRGHVQDCALVAAFYGLSAKPAFENIKFLTAASDIVCDLVDPAVAQIANGLETPVVVIIQTAEVVNEVHIDSVFSEEDSGADIGVATHMCDCVLDDALSTALIDKLRQHRKDLEAIIQQHRDQAAEEEVNSSTASFEWKRRQLALDQEQQDLNAYIRGDVASEEEDDGDNDVPMEDDDQGSDSDAYDDAFIRDMQAQLEDSKHYQRQHDDDEDEEDEEQNNYDDNADNATLAEFVQFVRSTMNPSALLSMTDAEWSDLASHFKTPVNVLKSHCLGSYEDKEEEEEEEEDEVEMKLNSQFDQTPGHAEQDTPVVVSKLKPIVYAPASKLSSYASKLSPIRLSEDDVMNVGFNIPATGLTPTNTQQSARPSLSLTAEAAEVLILLLEGERPEVQASLNAFPPLYLLLRCLFSSDIAIVPDEIFKPKTETTEPTYSAEDRFYGYVNSEDEEAAQDEDEEVDAEVGTRDATYEEDDDELRMCLEEELKDLAAQADKLQQELASAVSRPQDQHQSDVEEDQEEDNDEEQDNQSLVPSQISANEVDEVLGMLAAESNSVEKTLRTLLADQEALEEMQNTLLAIAVELRDSGMLVDDDEEDESEEDLQTSALQIVMSASDGKHKLTKRVLARAMSEIDAMGMLLSQNADALMARQVRVGELYQSYQDAQQMIQNTEETPQIQQQDEENEAQQEEEEYEEDASVDSEELRALEQEAAMLEAEVARMKAQLMQQHEEQAQLHSQLQQQQQHVSETEARRAVLDQQVQQAESLQKSLEAADDEDEEEHAQEDDDEMVGNYPVSYLIALTSSALPALVKATFVMREEADVIEALLQRRDLRVLSVALQFAESTDSQDEEMSSQAIIAFVKGLVTVAQSPIPAQQQDIEEEYEEDDSNVKPQSVPALTPQSSSTEASEEGAPSAAELLWFVCEYPGPLDTPTLEELYHSYVKRYEEEHGTEPVDVESNPLKRLLTWREFVMARRAALETHIQNIEAEEGEDEAQEEVEEEVEGGDDDNNADIEAMYSKLANVGTEDDNQEEEELDDAQTQEWLNAILAKADVALKTDVPVSTAPTHGSKLDALVASAAPADVVQDIRQHSSRASQLKDAATRTQTATAVLSEEDDELLQATLTPVLCQLQCQLVTALESEGALTSAQAAVLIANAKQGDRRVADIMQGDGDWQVKHRLIIEAAEGGDGDYQDDFDEDQETSDVNALNVLSKVIAEMKAKDSPALSGAQFENKDPVEIAQLLIKSHPLLVQSAIELFEATGDEHALEENVEVMFIMHKYRQEEHQ